MFEKLTLFYTPAMKTTVVCGQLGSGKTTYVKNILAKADSKTVVLVNDFGKLGIDAEVISTNGIETVELPSGCVCCTLKFDLITTIQTIRERYHPERLIIEPSGVATVSGILEALQLAKIEEVSVVGIIDSTEFAELYESGAFGNYFEDLIQNSDLILLNKVDLTDIKTLRRSRQIVESINPRAIVFETHMARLEEPLELVYRQKTPLKEANNVALQLESFSVNLKKGTDLKTMEVFFNSLSSGRFGKILRAKALLNTDEGSFRFDYASSRVFKEPFDRAVTESRVVLIGTSLKRDAILKALGITELLLTPQ